MKGTALLMASGRPAEMTPQQKLGYGYLTGMMPLHMAATEEIAKLLISRGADLNVRVTSGPHKGKSHLMDLSVLTMANTPKSPSSSANTAAKSGMN